MSDSDDYNESSDEDYVPQGEDVSEEEESGEDEGFDPSTAADGEGATNETQGKKKRKSEAETAKRKRRGGIKLDGEVREDDQENEEERKKKEEEDQRITAEVQKEMDLMKEQEESKKIDDLWSSFLSDVDHKPKPAAPSKGSSSSLASLSKPISSKSSSSSSSAKPTTSPASAIEKKPEKVTITKVFDFAGEEVTVTKEVSADSKEAKEAAQEAEDQPAAAASAVPGLSGVKRPSAGGGGGGGLGSVLGKIGKKQKISVLDKSKLDWDTFKQKEGIDEELKTHNRGKDGYIERMKFLEKVDYNQFEIERNLRQGKR